MLKRLLALGVAFAFTASAQHIILVHDDPGPMDALATGLTRANFRVLAQTQPEFLRVPSLDRVQAVFMYVHGALDARVELRLIQYAERGGRLIVIHHGAASGKSSSPDWLPFLGLRILPRAAPANGWDVLRGDVEVVNLNPGHYVTAHDVPYDRTAAYTPGDAPSTEQILPSFVMPATEVFLNQLFTDARAKTVLLGLKITINGRTIQQDRGGWYKPVGKGHVFYFQPGHQAADFLQPTYSAILVNAVRWRPPADR